MWLESIRTSGSIRDRVAIGAAIPTGDRHGRLTTFTELSQRIEETKKAGDSVGATLVGYYLTMGQYDQVAISWRWSTRRRR